MYYKTNMQNNINTQAPGRLDAPQTPVRLQNGTQAYPTPASSQGVFDANGGLNTPTQANAAFFPHL